MKESSKVERSIIEALKETKLPFRIVVGKKHKKVFIKDEMIGVYSTGRCNDRNDKSFLSKIRQYVRTH